jgi:GNAT superfamily N-acetyltransferase
MTGRYPAQQAMLRDGRWLLIRPFVQHDTDALWQFFQRLPPEIRRFAWDDIGDRALVDEWGHGVDYSKVLPLIAVDGSKVVADATLHLRKGGPLRLVGRVKWLIDPQYRGHGLGTLLVQSLARTAKERGMKHLTCMLMADQEKDAIATLDGLGFQRYIVPGYGCDPDGNPHDMVKMVLKL